MLWGVKSPYPIVESVVIAKYQSLTRMTVDSTSGLQLPNS